MSSPLRNSAGRSADLEMSRLAHAQRGRQCIHYKAYTELLRTMLLLTLPTAVDVYPLDKTRSTHLNSCSVRHNTETKSRCILSQTDFWNIENAFMMENLRELGKNHCNKVEETTRHDPSLPRPQGWLQLDSYQALAIGASANVFADEIWLSAGQWVMIMPPTHNWRVIGLSCTALGAYLADDSRLKRGTRVQLH